MQQDFEAPNSSLDSNLKNATPQALLALLNGLELSHSGALLVVNNAIDDAVAELCQSFRRPWWDPKSDFRTQSLPTILHKLPVGCMQRLLAKVARHPSCYGQIRKHFEALRPSLHTASSAGGPSPTGGEHQSEPLPPARHRYDARLGASGSAGDEDYEDGEDDAGSVTSAATAAIGRAYSGSGSGGTGSQYAPPSLTAHMQDGPSGAGAGAGAAGDVGYMQASNMDLQPQDDFDKEEQEQEQEEEEEEVEDESSHVVTGTGLGSGSGAGSPAISAKKHQSPVTLPKIAPAANSRPRRAHAPRLRRGAFLEGDGGGGGSKKALGKRGRPVQAKVRRPVKAKGSTPQGKVGRPEYVPGDAEAAAIHAAVCPEWAAIIAHSKVHASTARQLLRPGWHLVFTWIDKRTRTQIEATAIVNEVGLVQDSGSGLLLSHPAAWVQHLRWQLNFSSMPTDCLANITVWKEGARDLLQAYGDRTLKEVWNSVK